MKQHHFPYFLTIAILILIAITASAVYYYQQSTDPSIEETSMEEEITPEDSSETNEVIEETERAEEKMPQEESSKTPSNRSDAYTFSFETQDFIKSVSTEERLHGDVSIFMNLNNTNEDQISIGMIFLSDADRGDYGGGTIDFGVGLSKEDFSCKALKENLGALEVDCTESVNANGTSYLAVESGPLWTDGTTRHNAFFPHPSEEFAYLVLSDDILLYKEGELESETFEAAHKALQNIIETLTFNSQK